MRVRAPVGSGLWFIFVFSNRIARVAVPQGGRRKGTRLAYDKLDEFTGRQGRLKLIGCLERDGWILLFLSRLTLLYY